MFICPRRFPPKQMSHIHGQENDVKRDLAISRCHSEGRPPSEVTAETRICITCNRAIVYEIADVENNPSSVRLNVLSQTRKDRCLICNAQNNLHRPPVNCRVNVFVHSNVYIPDGVRSCAEHHDENYNLLIIFHPGLNFINRAIVIKGNEMQEFLLQFRLVAINPVRYEDENCFTDSEIKILTLVTKEQFLELCAYCHPVPRTENDRYFRVVSKKDSITRKIKFDIM